MSRSIAFKQAHALTRAYFRDPAHAGHDYRLMFGQFLKQVRGSAPLRSGRPVHRVNPFCTSASRVRWTGRLSTPAPGLPVARASVPLHGH